MKHIYILIVCVVVLGVISFRTLGFHAIEYDREEIDVTLVYNDEKIKKTVPNFSTLETVLEDMSFEDTIDLNKLNYQMILSHGDIVTIPIKTDSVCISINTGTAEELATLPGVGPKTALSIIEYRESFGMFQTLEDLMKVKGIGVKKFEKMVDDMCL